MGSPGQGSTLTLNGGVLGLQMNAGVSAYPTTVGGNTTIQLSTSNQATPANNILGTLSIGSNTLTVSGVSTVVTSGTSPLTFGTTTLTGNPTFNVTDVGNPANVLTSLTLGALNDGGTPRTIAKTGNASLTLATATSTLNGAQFNVGAGTLNSNNATALGSLASVDVADGAAFSVGATQTIAALTNTTTVNNTGSVVLGSGFTLTVGGSNNLASSFSGAISGAGALTKAGANTLTLSGPSTYSGGTTLTSGTLRAAYTTNSPTASSTGVGSVTLNGGTLTSTAGATSYIFGTVAGGSGAHTITPGGDGTIGTLAVGGFTPNSSSTLKFDISSTSSLDQINDSGAFGFGSTGAATIEVPTGLTGATYKLIGFGSTSLTTGANPVNFSLATLSGGSAPVTYSLNLTPSELDLVVISSNPVPAISIANGNGRFLAGGTTSGVISGSVTNNGGSDFNFTSIVNKSGVTGTLTNILPQSGTAQASNGNSVGWTAGIDGTSATAGTSYSFGVTVSDSSTPTPYTANSSTISLTAVASRTVGAPTSTPLGRLLTNSTVNMTSNGTSDGYGTGGTGAHGDTEDATLSYSGSADANGINLVAGNTTDNSSSGGTRSFTGTITGTGSTSGSFSVSVSREFSGAQSNVSFAYTADPVAPRVITNGATTDLGLYHINATIGSTPSNAFTTSGTHDTTTDVQVAAGCSSPDSQRHFAIGRGDELRRNQSDRQRHPHV